MILEPISIPMTWQIATVRWCLLYPRPTISQNFTLVQVIDFPTYPVQLAHLRFSSSHGDYQDTDETDVSGKPTA